MLPVGEAGSATTDGDPGQRRRVVDEQAGQLGDAARRRPRRRSARRPLSLQDEAGQAERDGVAVHERPEADTLHGAGDPEAGVRRRVTAPLSRCGAAGRRRACRRSGCRRSVVSSTTMPFGLGGDLADPRGAGAERVGAQRGERGIGLVGRDDRDDLALVGDVERVDARAGRRRPLTAGSTGSSVSSSTTARSVSRASSLQTVPTPPRVGSRSQRVDGAASSRASTSSPSGAVSERMSASRARSPRASITAMPWSAIVPETSTTSPGRTRSGPSARPAGTTPDAGGRDVQPVGRAPADHLRVAGDDA